MSTLSRRREKDRQVEHWLIFADDIHIGSIGMRSGVPVHAEQWQWTVSVYPASHRGIRASGISPDYQTARASFEQAWREIEPKITEADRLEHRRARAHTEWKYRMWETGCKLPSQVASGRSQCYCGTEIDSAGIGPHIDGEHTT
jgi:hypothetical protein